MKGMMAMAEYIEREALRDTLYEADAITMRGVAILNQFPAADVRPVVRGKWVEHNYDPEYLSCDFSCSECNVYLEEYYFGEGQWPGKTDHYFCPNCGADMREES